MKSSNLIVRSDFFFNLFEQKILPEPVDSIAYSHNLDFCLLEQDNYQELQGNNTVFSIKSVPEYFTANVNINYSVEEIKQYHKGYAIRLEEDFPNIDAYLKFKFKSKAREIRRYVKRLETCYVISYKMFFGDISQNEYDALFKALHTMLDIRFKQKKEINDRLLEWERLYNMFFNLINTNKASIFVIYESNTPISISLNYIFDKFYFNAIASYNVNYSKFGLGNVMIYKQLQWCISRKFNFYEMGRGDYAYKGRWSNYAYTLYHYIVTPKKASFSALLCSKIEGFRVKLFEYLRSKKVNIIYNYVKSTFYRLSTSKTLLFDYVVREINSEEMPEQVKQINFEDKQFLKLQKPINDFLFSNMLHKNNIRVYKLDESYFLEGNNVCQKIIFR